MSEKVLEIRNIRGKEQFVVDDACLNGSAIILSVFSSLV